MIMLTTQEAPCRLYSSSDQGQTPRKRRWERRRAASNVSTIPRCSDLWNQAPRWNSFPFYWRHPLSRKGYWKSFRCLIIFWKPLQTSGQNDFIPGESDTGHGLPVANEITRSFPSCSIDDLGRRAATIHWVGGHQKSTVRRPIQSTTRYNHVNFRSIYRKMLTSLPNQDYTKIAVTSYTHSSLLWGIPS